MKKLSDLSLAPKDEKKKKKSKVLSVFSDLLFISCVALWNIMTFAAAGVNKKSYDITKILLIQLSGLTFTDVKGSRDVTQ